MPILVQGKSVLDESFEEFEKDNHEYVQPGAEADAEKAEFEKDKAHAIKNNNDPNSTFMEALNPWSDLPKEEFLKEKTGVIMPGMVTKQTFCS